MIPQVLRLLMVVIAYHQVIRQLLQYIIKKQYHLHLILHLSCYNIVASAQDSLFGVHYSAGTSDSTPI